MQATIIYNPRAGKVNLAAIVELVADMWRARGWEMQIKPTKAAGHATKLAEEAAAAGQRLVLAAGGDGTLGEVANGLAGSETVMGLLPVGTANSFARELGLPRPTFLDRHKLLKASDALAAGKVQAMDLGYTRTEGRRSSANGRYWLLWTGVGADSHTVSRVEPRPAWSKKLGITGYFLQGVAVTSTFSHVRARVEIDGQAYEDDYILVLISNCRQYGGILNLSPHARLDDGLFEVWLFRGHGLPQLSRHLASVWRGQHLHNRDVTMIRGRHVAVHTETPAPYQTDGDYAGNTPLECEIKPGALKLLVPDSAPADLFSRPARALIPAQ